MSYSFDCPYCEYDIPEDFADGQPESEQECPECGKKFYLEATLHPHFYTEKRDCWNGSDHDFIIDLLGEDYWKEQGSVPYHCRKCNTTQWRKVTNEIK